VSRASVAYTALTLALDRTPAECHRVDLFIADDLTPADAHALSTICAACPVMALCAAYAAIARPLAGFWAGHRSGYYRAQKNRTINERKSNAD